MAARCPATLSPDGATAEIWAMNLDGSQQRQITHLDVMSWAPYFHPSGAYIIFTNNAQGMGNFELYIVDSAGQHEPVRVTSTDGFDGLPVFSPDGQHLAWTSTRTPDHTAQIFMANWNDAEARALLDSRAQRHSRRVPRRPRTCGRRPPPSPLQTSGSTLATWPQKRWAGGSPEVTASAWPQTTWPGCLAL